MNQSAFSELDHGFMGRNAFRILEMPVDSNSRRLNRRCSLIEKEIRNNIAPPLGDLSVYPKGIPSGPNGLQQFEDDVRKLSNETREPPKRLVHEWFWFWAIAESGDSRSDPALGSFERDPAGGAAFTLWYEMVESRSPSAGIAAHNLAVFFLRAGYDAAEEILATSQPISDAITDSLLGHLHRGWSWWKTLFDPDYGLWPDCETRLISRIADLDDPSLASWRPLRFATETCPALARIQANLALALMDRGKRDLAYSVMGNLSQEISDSELETAARPLVAELRKSIDLASESATHASRTDPRRASATAEDYFETACGPLDRISLLLPPGHTACEGAFDKVANTGLQCQISYAEKTKDWAGSVKLLEKFARLAKGESVKKRLLENLHIIKENDRFARINDLCWFCGFTPKSEKDEHEVAMHGDVVRGLGGVTWNHAIVKIPCCEACARAQSKASTAGGCTLASLVSASLLVALLIPVLQDAWSWPQFIIIMVVGLIFSGVMGAFANAQVMQPHLKKLKVKKLNDRNDFPLIRELRKKGWEFGEKPMNLQ